MSRSRWLTVLPTWLIYALCMVPAVYYFERAFANKLGPDPLDALENALGEWALIMLIIGLCVTPLLRFGKINLVKYRRPFGVAAFTFVFLHFAVYIVLDRQLNGWEIWNDILKRPYITIGTAAFLMLLPLAITSNNKSVKRLGATAWKKLHWLTYPAAFFGAVHYLLLVKAWPFEPIAYLAIITLLIALRLIWMGPFARRRTAST